ncbi:MAG: aldo/keto reductase [Gammaproteobacteria bacterium]|nr:aldo/keto reductase [Gammaproteobacteria bacterium]
MTNGARDLPRRRLGSSDIEVTCLGFGGGPVGGVGSEDAEAVLEAAWNGGIRYFDTAPLYGMSVSEQRVGSFLRTRPRDEFVLSTKVGRLLVPAATDESRLVVEFDYSRDGVGRSLNESLERLGLERVDVLLCHDIDVYTHDDRQPDVFQRALEGALPLLTELKARGVVGAIGLGVNEWQVCEAVLEHVDVDCFLLAGRFTLLEQEALDTFLPRCVERDVSVIIGGPFNSGVLATADRDAATYNYRRVSDELWQRAQEIRRVCAAHDVDIRAAALQYPLRHPAVATIIPGVRSVAEVTQNLELFSAPIPDALWDDLASAGLTRYVEGGVLK